MLDAKEQLKIIFGFDDFRPGQADAVAAAMSGQDVLVVMPTGAGKSLCYQLPAICLPGVTLVVSPLIALMKDQVDELQRKGVAATFINSTLSVTESALRLNEISNGKYKLVYVAPERFYDQSFMDKMHNVNLSLFAVDEAHCISEWGHDFRPSYRHLKKAIDALGRPPVLALTATATPDVREDINRALQLHEPHVFVTGFDRPNITYGVYKTTPTGKIDKVVELLEQVTGPTIIYAGTRDNVNTLSEVLWTNGFSAAGYHAGMDKDERDKNQQDFMADKIRVMVATNAFGLGIDKPNVRLIIHFDLPGTLEAYYQEAGRAGRDRQPSYAVLLYHPSDRYLREFFLEGENPSPPLIRSVYRHLLNNREDSIQTTYREIAENIPMKIPEMAIGTALKMLEVGGYIRRGSEAAHAAFVRVLQPIIEAEALISSRAKTQRILWDTLRKKYDEVLETGVQFSVDEVASWAQMEREAVVRVLRAMAAKNILEYKPPFRGQDITLLQRVPAETLALDWAALRDKRAREENKLKLMEGYVYSLTCRRAYVLRYLGDTNLATNCQSCDVCL